MNSIESCVRPATETESISQSDEVPRHTIADRIATTQLHAVGIINNLNYRNNARTFSPSTGECSHLSLNPQVKEIPSAKMASGSRAVANLVTRVWQS